MPTAIEWTDQTWNPVTGCDRVSPGCAHCYALTLAKRLKAMGLPGYQRDGDQRTSGPGFGVTLHPDKLEEPLRWRRPRRVFVNSMSDLFHEEIPDSFITEACDVMEKADRHTFQVLTKRPDRALAWARDQWCDDLPPNVWLGVSIENARYTWRADILREIPAAVRFISAEPLLGSLYPLLDCDCRANDWVEGDNGAIRCEQCGGYTGEPGTSIAVAPVASKPRANPRRKPLDLSGIDWVIIGGESGPKARPFHLEHAREIIETADTWPGRVLPPAIFVKQLGAKPVALIGDPRIAPPTPVVQELRDRKGGDWDEWPHDLRIREFPRTTVPA